LAAADAAEVKGPTGKSGQSPNRDEAVPGDEVFHAALRGFPPRLFAAVAAAAAASGVRTIRRTTRGGARENRLMSNK